jgi:hypothetical protein
MLDGYGRGEASTVLETGRRAWMVQCCHDVTISFHCRNNGRQVPVRG